MENLNSKFLKVALMIQSITQLLKGNLNPTSLQELELFQLIF